MVDAVHDADAARELPGEERRQAGSVLYPEAAAAFPTVSNNGKTYVFHIRPGLKFSDGSAVTAASFQRAWERNLSPKMGSPVGVNDSFQDVIVGAQAFLDGKAQKISGITAKGLTLTFRLTKPNPTFTAYQRHAVVRRRQAEHAVHELGHEHVVSVRRPVLHPEP